MPDAFPPQNSSSPFASWAGDHAGIRAPDFDAAVAWYQDKLDFRVLRSWPVGEKMFAKLAPPSDDGFVIELIAGPGQDRPAYEDLLDSQRQLGWHHLCFRVSDVSEAIAELRRRGVTIVKAPWDVPAIGVRIAFFADPWGNLFEVLQPIPRA